MPKGEAGDTALVFGDVSARPDDAVGEPQVLAHG